MKMMDYDFDPIFPAVLKFLIGVIVFVIATNLAHKRKEKAYSSKLPPIPNIGIWETYKLMSPRDFLWHCMKFWKDFQYCSTIRFNLLLPPWVPMLVTVNECDLARRILVDPATTKPHYILKSLDYITGGVSIFSSNGETWHSRRIGMTSAFSGQHIKRMHTVALDEIDKWIGAKLLNPIKENEEPMFDVGKEMIGVTLGALAKTAFEYEMSDDEKEMFPRELGLGFDEFTGHASNPARKFLGFFSAERKRAFIGTKRIMDFALKIIRDYQKIENPIEGTIMHCIMKNNCYKNDRERATDVISILFAGHDTTAFSIAWTLKALAKNPIEQANLRKSLENIEKSKWSQTSSLRNAVKEAVRMHPVTALVSARILGQDFTSPEGDILPKGSFVYINNLSIMRNPHVFHNPDKYDPSRWNEPSESMKRSYLPFSLGKRNCVGQNLAQIELHSMVAKIISMFELELVEEGTEENILTLRPVNTILRARAIL